VVSFQDHRRESNDLRETNHGRADVKLTTDGVVRAGLAVVAGCTAATALYAILRVSQALIFTEPDPALVIWSEHSGFFWRSWTVFYVGGMAALLTWMISARHAERVASVLARALPVAAALLAAQAMLVP
jgi:hypothetical protein